MENPANLFSRKSLLHITNEEFDMRIQPLVLLRRVFLALAAGTALCLAPLALATSVTLIPTGFANGSESLSVHNVPAPIFNPLSTGGFAGTLDGDPIVFFCFELTQSFNFNPSPPYTYDDSLLSLTDPTKANYLSELFTEGFATAVSTTNNSAGFQLAVWEILGETTPGDVNSPDGNFYVTDNHGNQTAQDRANTLLAGLSGSQALYTIHLLHSETNQDFIYGTFTVRQEVPEPAPLLLIGAALAAMLFALRQFGRRQRA
jgi:hypothetical protein